MKPQSSDRDCTEIYVAGVVSQGWIRQEMNVEAHCLLDKNELDVDGCFN